MDKLLNQYGESPESDGIYQHPSTIWFQFHQKFTISHTCCLLSDCWCSGNLNNNHLHIKSPTHVVASDSLSLQTKPKPAERGTTPVIPNHRSELPVAWSSGTIFPYKLAFIEFYIGRAGQRWNRMWTLEWHCWPVVFFVGSFFFCLKNGIVLVAIFSKMIVENSLFSPPPTDINLNKWDFWGWMFW